ncbi:FMN-binding negative transcriptional regulator [Chthoniobacter flavus Ellin428]|uniref:FMN-binding negative transcriptional regulator n=1 Tax=Chthoniobacter flavus Ellin428 TaxID=497964 RepID=B4CW31_9BACT|nr:FMN-binding negative transcriptional regulator [Chthoniobacter flavus]EDY21623.1 FMN-binding negative transcriptional regulator [Chthoniobacter flavus Ellin428]TCO95561.1 PaiB family negative transcriptional regulator [Chthoniobacter flavus]
MYIPPAFRIEDKARLASFLREYSFATFITNDDATPFASHLPMLFRPDLGEHGTLIAHLARANPQWRHFAEGREALAIFHGPHAYISPTWYETAPAVPTWNYAVVHAYGIPKIFENRDRIAALLQETISVYESSFAQPWSGQLPVEYLDKMIHGVVAFEIPITRLEGKFKLGQNRSPEDVQGVFRALSQSASSNDRALAQFMAAEGHVKAAS